MNPSAISSVNDGDHQLWAWCLNAFQCGQHIKLELTAIIAEHGDISFDELRRRLI